MRKLKQEKIPWIKIRFAVFFFVFCGYSCLFSRSLVEADTGKKIKIHPNAVPNSLRSTEDLKAKAEAYNNEAIALFEEGRYAEAQELWEKAIGLMEHPRAQYGELETVDEEQPSFETPESSVMSDETLETPPIVEKYQSGLSLLEQKEYGEAKRVFQEIDAMQSDYRNTRRYLTVIDELLREEDSPVEQEPRSDEAQEQVAADREEYPEIVPEPQGIDTDPGFDPRQEETQWEEAVEQAEQKLQDQITESVEPIYQKALQHYKRKEYVEARDGFEQAQVLSPGYKLTAKYLDGIDDDILYAQQQKEEEQRLAEERARRQDELEFRKVVAAREVSYRKELMGKAEEIYRQAIEDFKNRKFEEAEDGFRKVDTTAPSYKLTDKYLGYIQKARDEKIRLQAEEEARRQALAQHDEEEDMRRTVKKSDRMRQQGLRESAEAVYQNARTDYGQGEIEKARVGFSEVEQILPDYRSARKYLALIDEDVAKEKKVEKEQKVKLEKVRQPETSADLTEKVETVVVPTSRKRLEAQELYRQAKESYKKHEFAKAKSLFEKVNAAVGSYQATEKFLARIDSDIQKETRYQQDMQEREVRRQTKEMRYQQGLQRREAQRQSRKKAFEEKRATAEAAAARRRQETRELKETVARIKNDRDKMVTDKIQELYREAESDYTRGLYALARERFNEVQRIAPGYRSTEEYLGNIAYAYGSEVTVAPIPVPPRMEQEILRAPISVVEEEIIIPAKKIAASGVAEPDDEVAADYDAGILLFKRKQYVRAREKLERVVQAAPGYKSTSAYLNRIDSLLQEEQQRQLEEQQQALARAIRKEKKVKKSVPPDVVQQTVSEAQKLEPEGAVVAPVEASAKEDSDRELHMKAQERFQEAERLYASRQFVSAREKFLEIEGLVPGYKSTGKYLARIDRDLLEEQQKTQRMKQKQEREAASRVAKEKTAEKIAEKNQLNIKKAEEEKRARLLAQAEKKYAQALSSYTKNDFISAKQKFAEVEKFFANFKETAQYLGRIDADIAAQDQKPKEVTATPIYVQPHGVTIKEQARVQADALFHEAVRLYASKKFISAREKFYEAERLIPGYKTTGKYIALTDRAIARQQEKESRTKQIQDARTALLAAGEQRERERVEKTRQENERKRQAQAKRVPAAAPAVKLVWVDPPDFNAFELTDDAGVLRRQYTQIQKERKGVQSAIRLRLDQTYAQAVRLYNQGYYAGAKNLFQEIAEIQPSFTGIKNYLAQIDQKLAKLPASAIMPGKGIEAPSVYVKPRKRVVTDALDSLEAPRQ